MKISIHDVKHHALALSTISFEADHIGHIKALEDIPPKKSALLSHAQCLEYLAVSLGYNTYKGLSTAIENQTVAIPSYDLTAYEKQVKHAISLHAANALEDTKSVLCDLTLAYFEQLNLSTLQPTPLSQLFANINPKYCTRYAWDISMTNLPVFPPAGSKIFPNEPNPKLAKSLSLKAFLSTAANMALADCIFTPDHDALLKYADYGDLSIKFPFAKSLKSDVRSSLISLFKAEKIDVLSPFFSLYFTFNGESVKLTNYGIYTAMHNYSSQFNEIRQFSVGDPWLQKVFDLENNPFLQEAIQEAKDSWHDGMYRTTSLYFEIQKRVAYKTFQNIIRGSIESEKYGLNREIAYYFKIPVGVTSLAWYNLFEKVDDKGDYDNRYVIPPVNKRQKIWIDGEVTQFDTRLSIQVVKTLASQQFKNMLVVSDQKYFAPEFMQSLVKTLLSARCAIICDAKDTLLDDNEIQDIVIKHKAPLVSVRVTDRLQLEVAKSTDGSPLPPHTNFNPIHGMGLSQIAKVIFLLCKAYYGEERNPRDLIYKILCENLPLGRTDYTFQEITRALDQALAAPIVQHEAVLSNMRGQCGSFGECKFWAHKSQPNEMSLVDEIFSNSNIVLDSLDFSAHIDTLLDCVISVAKDSRDLAVNQYTLDGHIAHFRTFKRNDYSITVDTTSSSFHSAFNIMLKHTEASKWSTKNIEGTFDHHSNLHLYFIRDAKLADELGLEAAIDELHQNHPPFKLGSDS